MVVSNFACPSKTWIRRTSVFCSSRWVAKLCRLFRARNKRHYAESRIMPSCLRKAVAGRGVEPALLGIILTPPKAIIIAIGRPMELLEAGVYFRDRVVARTRVRRNHPSLPDRQLGIEGKGPREDDALCWAPRVLPARWQAARLSEQPVTPIRIMPSNGIGRRAPLP